MELSLLLVKMKWPKLPNETMAYLTKLENMIISLSQEQIKDDTLQWTPWLSKYKQTMMRVLLANFDQLTDGVTVLTQGIKSPFYEVRTDVLQFMTIRWEKH